MAWAAVIFVRGVDLLISRFAHPLPIIGVQFGGISLPANRGAILFLLLPGMVYLWRYWNGCRCHGFIEHPRVIECE